ncbi:fucolectin-4 isoform X2 [Dicentrarchus labrax]|uniref:fucolectin-4 isoform X2 n=1 Tax=Dicentrarchus labrax TaxID=13489 RepID=UPI0021F60642|nr:fucolectin-4 isoform X2 [Dicentrarchus labrax]
MKNIVEKEKGQQVKMLWSLLLIPLIGLQRNANGHVSDCRPEGTKGTSQDMEELNGTTSQSSNYTHGNTPYVSERAIDGNKDICAHTLCLEFSWWRIDLEGVYTISCISIYNKDKRTIEKAHIYIGNSRESNGTANKINKTITNFNKTTWNHFQFNQSASGRYITVFLPEHENLILCEVKIYGKKKESPFKLIKENKTWEEALYHCRDNEMDLASILDDEDQAWAELQARDADTDHVWLGLHYTCILQFWFWVDDNRLDFSRLDQESKEEECDTSVVMETQEEHLWFRKSDYDEFNFICRVRKEKPRG